MPNLQSVLSSLSDAQWLKAQLQAQFPSVAFGAIVVRIPPNQPYLYVLPFVHQGTTVELVLETGETLGAIVARIQELAANLQAGL